MAIRKTPDDYHKLARQRGFEWLGPKVSRILDKTWWGCDQGHEWETKYNTIQQGRGCPYCARVVPKTEADYKQLAKERGLVWLGPEVASNKASTRWQCPKGHTWDTAYGNIRSGCGCPHCARKQEEDYHNIAGERNAVWLGPMPKDVTRKTKWQCSSGHEWHAPYSHLQQGGGCRECAINARRKSPDDYTALAKERGLVWLGPPVPNTKTKTGWQCQRGHIWETTYDPIRRGCSCPTCKGINNARRTRKKPRDYELLAERNGLVWLGPEVHNNSIKTKWRCQSGHVWETTYDIIQGGSSCPVCNESRGERDIRQTLDSLDIHYQRQRKFRKCKDRGMLPFDFYFTLYGHRFLVEYDGQQHFFPMDFFGGEGGFAEQKRRDEIKNTFAREYGFDLIRVPYTASDIGDYLIGEIARITGKGFEDIAFRQPQASIVPVSFDEAPAEGFQLSLFYADD